MLLKDLSMEEKLSLIELLVKSIQASSISSKKSKKQPADQNTAWVQSFSGSWNDFPESAEDMIALIENARTLSRPVEML